ncbi:MAG: type II toxin-antitoxin system HicA family toxin [Ignavibacteriales bacterium]|nr:type II toxin-antitoxin system HicA family toxin [Ignavibacteriales bacterium]
MAQTEKILEQVLRGSSDANVTFADLCKLLSHFGFHERIKGSHHIYFKDEIQEIINIQPDGSKAKPYQVKQVRNIILKYKLG